VKKYGRTEQDTDGNIIQSMHFVCWKTKASDTY